MILIAESPYILILRWLTQYSSLQPTGSFSDTTHLVMMYDGSGPRTTGTTAGPPELRYACDYRSYGEKLI